MIDDVDFWAVTLLLGLGTYLIRFSFLGFIGNRPLPPWLRRHLAYVPVAIMPALVAPLTVWPAATGGTPDPARLAAGLAALAAGALFRNPVAAIAAGFAVLFGLPLVFGA
ncbi:MAG TPA: AzlD domain-containing protein [Paracoccaceae bacterium]|nr:AzlD domain-containing protein [Paracoccaceae bacterium]